MSTRRTDQRSNKRDPIRDRREFWKQLTNVDPRNRCCDRRKLATNLHGGFGLHVDRIKLRRAAIQMHKHNTFSRGHLPGSLFCPEQPGQRCYCSRKDSCPQNITSSELSGRLPVRLLLLFHSWITPEETESTMKDQTLHPRLQRVTTNLHRSLDRAKFLIIAGHTLRSRHLDCSQMTTCTTAPTVRPAIGCLVLHP
jgi:hypothetical protein